MMAQDAFDTLQRQIAYRLFYDSPLEKAAKLAIYKEAMAERFHAMCCDLRAAGYHTLYVGASPYWGHRGSNHLVAVPSIASDAGLALWYITDRYFYCSCGNGLGEADQRQLTYALPKDYEGEHDLCHPKYQSKSSKSESSTKEKAVF